MTVADVTSVNYQISRIVPFYDLLHWCSQTTRQRNVAGLELILLRLFALYNYVT